MRERSRYSESHPTDRVSCTYKKLPHENVKLPARKKKGAYDDQASIRKRRFVAERY